MADANARSDLESSGSGPMGCEQVCALLYAFAHDRLAGDEHEAVRTHLESCAACREEADALGEIDQILKKTLTAHAAQRSSAAPAIMARIDAGVSDTLRRVSRRHVHPVRRSWLPLVATALLVAILLAVTIPAALWQYVPAPAPITIEVEGEITDPRFKQVKIYVDGELASTSEITAGKFKVIIPVTARQVVVEAYDEAGNVIRKTITVGRGAP